MDSGDPKFCNQPRKSEVKNSSFVLLFIFLLKKNKIIKIRFICGIKDELKQVQEPSKCVYEFDMITPAAC
jgi:hypothetical protein